MPAIKEAGWCIARQRILLKELGIEVRIENDVNLATLALLLTKPFGALGNIHRIGLEELDHVIL